MTTSMTTNKAIELLGQATPRPWGVDHESPNTVVAHDGTGAFVMRLGDARVFSYAVQMDKNVDLAIYAVNHLSDLLAAVDALDRLHTTVEMFFEGAAGDPAMIEARSALDRLGR